jgi:hypothetical protein
MSILWWLIIHCSCRSIPTAPSRWTADSRLGKVSMTRSRWRTCSSRPLGRSSCATACGGQEARPAGRRVVQAALERRHRSYVAQSRDVFCLDLTGFGGCCSLAHSLLQWYSVPAHAFPARHRSRCCPFTLSSRCHRHVACISPPAQRLSRRLHTSVAGRTNVDTKSRQNGHAPQTRFSSGSASSVSDVRGRPGAAKLATKWSGVASGRRPALPVTPLPHRACPPCEVTTSPEVPRNSDRAALRAILAPAESVDER